MTDKTSIYSGENRVETPVYAQDVFKLTEKGAAQIGSGSATSLPRTVLAVLVMLDGKRKVGDVEQCIPNLHPKTIRNILRSLLSADLVRETTMAERGDISLDFTAFFDAAARDSSLGVEASAQLEARDAAPQLEKQGYYVAIARQTVKPAIPGRRLATLIVEDDPDMANLVRRLLPPARYETTVATGRNEVLSRLNQIPSPDVAILDVNLPDLNGFQLLERMKAHPVLKSIPVLMLTADAEPKSIARGLMGGADGYVTKPFDHDALVNALGAVLGLAGTQQAEAR